MSSKDALINALEKHHLATIELRAIVFDSILRKFESPWQQFKKPGS
jgi:hypothetical protein